MVLPLFYSPITSLPAVGSRVVLDGAEAKHAISVRRMRVGEGIQLSNGEGIRVVGRVAEVIGNELHVEVDSAVRETPANPSITLIQALAKGDRDELAIQAATELGVSAVVPWQAERSISRWDGPKVQKGIDRWQTIVAEAAKQALRAFTPVVSEPRTSKQLSAMVHSFGLALVLDPTAEAAISQVDLPEAGSIALIVGPEGGISDPELGQFESAGAVRVRLGSEILRTSTAGMAAISVLQSRLGRW